MAIFSGGSTNRTSKPQTSRSAAQRRRNGDVAVSPKRNAQTEQGNRGFLGGGSRPSGERR